MLYSVPETIYPALLQVLAHDWGVSVAESGAWKLRIRPSAPSIQQPWLDHPEGKPEAAGVDDVEDAEDTVLVVPLLAPVPTADVVMLEAGAVVLDVGEPDEEETTYCIS